MWIKKRSRKAIINDLEAGGYVIKDHLPEVQVHERCGTEAEYSILKQWFIDIMNFKDDFQE